MGSTRTDQLVDKFSAVAGKINSLRYIKVIKNAFAGLLPVIITGAFATLLSAMVFDTTTGLAAVNGFGFLAEFKPLAAAINYVTLSFLTISAAFLIGVELGKLNQLTGAFSGVVAVMSYLVINPTFYNLVDADGKATLVENVIAKQYTDTKGLFLGMFVAIIAIEFYSWLNRQDKLRVKMPEGVPPNVANAFSALIPTIITVVTVGTFGFIFKMLTGQYIYDMMYAVVQKPLESIIQGLPGIFALMLISQFLWLIGIHGNQMIKPIREPLLLGAIAVNADAYAQGKEIPNIITMPFWDMYMSMGGSGVTIGLVIAILIFGRRADYKEVTKIGLIPSFFNINEPIIFGLPIMLNPIMAIPFIITPLVTGAIGYVATAVGFAAKAIVMVPWPTPPLISGYLATAGNIGAVITQLICILVSIAIYTPFVFIANKQAQKEQNTLA